MPTVSLRHGDFILSRCDGKMTSRVGAANRDIAWSWRPSSRVERDGAASGAARRVSRRGGRRHGGMKPAGFIPDLIQRAGASSGICEQSPATEVSETETSGRDLWDSSLWDRSLQEPTFWYGNTHTATTPRPAYTGRRRRTPGNSWRCNSGTGIERQPDAEGLLAGSAFRAFQLLGDFRCRSLSARHRLQFTNFGRGPGPPLLCFLWHNSSSSRKTGCIP